MRHDEYETHLTYVSYMLTVILPQTMSAAALLTRQLRSVLGSPVIIFVLFNTHSYGTSWRGYPLLEVQVAVGDH